VVNHPGFTTVIWAGSNAFIAHSRDMNAGGFELMPDHPCEKDGMRRIGVETEAVGLDPGKLMRLVAELNDSYSRGNAYAAHALLRAILDHVRRCSGVPTSRRPRTTTPGAALTAVTRGGFWTLSSN